MITVENLTELWPVRDVPGYGKCIVVPDKKFRREWEAELKSQGMVSLFQFIDGGPVALVRLKGTEKMDKVEKVDEVHNVDKIPKVDGVHAVNGVHSVNGVDKIESEDLSFEIIDAKSVPEPNFCPRQKWGTLLSRIPRGKALKTTGDIKMWERMSNSIYSFHKHNRFLDIDCRRAKLSDGKWMFYIFRKAEVEKKSKEALPS